MTWTKFQGFVGPSYPLKSKAIDAQRLINMYPEMIESGTGKESQVAYLKSIPGLENILEIGTGPIRLVLPYNRHTMDNPTFLVVSGADLYVVEILSDGTINTFQASQEDPDNRTFDTSSGPIKAETAIINYGTDISFTLFVDGVRAYVARIDLTLSGITGFTFHYWADIFTGTGP